MHRPFYFELAVQEPERAMEFYKQVFGWTIQKWDGPMEYYSIQTGEGQPGIDGGLYRAPDGVSRSINTIAVDDVDAAVEKIVAAGGTVQMAKTPIPGMGYFAAFKDTEGILFAVMSSDPEVK